MKKSIVLLFIVLLLTGCSSSDAGAVQKDEDHFADVILQPAQGDDVLSRFATGIQKEEAAEETLIALPGIHVETNVSGSNDGFFDPSKLSFEDFDELYGQMMYEGIPEDVVYLPLKNANGVWKYDLKIRYDSSVDGYMFDELGYVEMSVDGRNDPPISIVLHPRLAAFDAYEVYPETDEEVGYEPFAGGIDDDNLIRLFGNDCVLCPEYYYAYEGREYLIATLWMSEEDFGNFMMIRGQE
ncbi:MAG: lipoprotein [Erysipelotrichaceae bacterium]|nr:lipoprotein [Erysipelotrichaceae bacterium]